MSSDRAGPLAADDAADSSDADADAAASALAYARRVRARAASLARGLAPTPLPEWTPVLAEAADSAAEASLGADIAKSALAREYRDLQSHSCLYVAPHAARDLHPPTSRAAVAAHAAAREQLLALLGPSLGATPSTVGRAHIPRPLLLRRTRAAEERAALGPSAYVVPTATLVRLLRTRPARGYRTNLLFSAVPRFAGDGPVGPRESAQRLRARPRPATASKALASTEPVAAPDRVGAGDVDNDDDEGITIASASDTDTVSVHSAPAATTSWAPARFEEEPLQWSDSDAESDEGWHDVEFTDDDASASLPPASPAEAPPRPPRLRRASAPGGAEACAEAFLEGREELEAARTRSLARVRSRDDAATFVTREADSGFLRRFRAPSLAFSPPPAALADASWHRLCLHRARHRWRRERLLNAAGLSIATDLASAARFLEKREHSGLAFGPSLRRDGQSASSGRLERNRARLLLRALLGERQRPPVTIVADDCAVRRQRLVSAAPWASSAADEAAAASARASNALRRANGNSPFHSPPRGAPPRSSSVTTSGRDRVIIVPDAQRGTVHRVVVPFMAHPATVARVKRATGEFSPGPADYWPRSVHRTAPHALFGSGKTPARGSSAAAFGGVVDELGASGAVEGDVLELDTSRAYRRPNAAQGPRFSFPRAAQSRADSVDFQDDAELRSVHCADPQWFAAAEQQIRSALRLVESRRVL